MSDLPDDDLPLDICREIFFRLPVVSLFQVRAVCKRWRTVIDDPNFAMAHTINHQLSSSSHTLVIRNLWGPFDNLQTFDLDAVNLLFTGDQTISGSSLILNIDELSLSYLSLPVSACNGLILVRPGSPISPLISPLEIWNPSTHERLQLAPIGLISPSGPLLTGLGYDHAAQDFKAVAMQSKYTHVYSLRSDTWRTINGVCLGRDFLWGLEYNGVFLCGALHWLFDDKMIIALDLGTEKHRYIHLNNALPKTVEIKFLDVLDGCLAVSGFSDYQFFEVWVMNDYGSDDESWTKLFSINRLGLKGLYARPVAYLKEKNQVVLKDGCGSGFIVFDVESDSMKRFFIDGHGLNGTLGAQIIPQTIFRLRDHCGDSGIIPLCRQRKAMKVSLTIRTNH